MALAAMTTIFTPCSTSWLITTTKLPSQYPSFPTAAPAACAMTSWEAYLAQRGFGYYSPAICPSGFYVGPSCIVTRPRTGEGFPAIGVSETAAYCVPNGHICTSDTTDYRGGVWGVSATDTAKSATVTVGPAIQIRWRYEDLINLETFPLTPESTPIVLSSEVAISDTDPEVSSVPLEIITSSSRSVISAYPVSTPLSTPARSTPESTDDPRSPRSTTRRSISRHTLTSPAAVSGGDGGSSDARETHTPDAQGHQGGDESGRGHNDNNESGSGGKDDSTSGGGHNNKPSTLVAITAILIATMAAYATYAVWRRYRAYRAAGAEAGVEPSMKIWIREQLSEFCFVFSHQLRHALMYLRNLRSATEEKEKTPTSKKFADAELGTEGPLPELGSTHAFGTKENPAELPALERFSWISRVTRISRIFVARTRSVATV
ncbi:hypothetical protein F4777DRAFT_110277 [Nemania sp. FL0916]|nr:hypothetical protein F4777DRAFT_110277 [Nemania sp. FL0916]